MITSAGCSPGCAMPLDSSAARRSHAETVGSAGDVEAVGVIESAARDALAVDPCSLRAAQVFNLHSICTDEDATMLARDCGDWHHDIAMAASSHGSLALGKHEC